MPAMGGADERRWSRYTSRTNRRLWLGFCKAPIAASRRLRCAMLRRNGFRWRFRGSASQKTGKSPARGWHRPHGHRKTRSALQSCLPKMTVGRSGSASQIACSRRYGQARPGRSAYIQVSGQHSRRVRAEEHPKDDVGPPRRQRLAHQLPPYCCALNECMRHLPRLRRCGATSVGLLQTNEMSIRSQYARTSSSLSRGCCP